MLPYVAFYVHVLLTKSFCLWNEAPTKAEKQGRADRFDAMTRKFMFTISG